MGVTVEEGEDYLIVHGQNGEVEGGGTAQTHLDHRIAMSFLCLGLASKKSIKVDDGHAIATSFPLFKSLMTDLGAPKSVIKLLKSGNDVAIACPSSTFIDFLDAKPKHKNDIAMR